MLQTAVPPAIATPSYFAKGMQLPVLCGIALTTFFLVACTHSEFERQHEQAILENPTGVELEIRTQGNRRQFSLSEPVRFEEVYISKFSGLWHTEIFEGWNEASSPATDFVHITDGTTTWSQAREPLAGTICCDSRHVWLGPDPVRIPYKLTANLLYANPGHYVNPEWSTLRLPKELGKYQVYITTRRVFGRNDGTTTYHGKGVPVSSNVLQLEVK
jgi:hypothetical protein